MAERRELLSYQAKLDEARERLDNGKITQKEFEHIKADLAETMPKAVYEKLAPKQQEKVAEARADAEPVAVGTCTILTTHPDNKRIMRQATGLPLRGIFRPKNRLLQGKPCNLPFAGSAGIIGAGNIVSPFGRVQCGLRPASNREQANAVSTALRRRIMADYHQKLTNIAKMVYS